MFDEMHKLRFFPTQSTKLFGIIDVGTLVFVNVMKK